MAWMMAAMHTASSTRVHTSQMRNSSVGYDQLGRTSHQILEPSGMECVCTSVSTIYVKSDQDWNERGIPLRGKLRKMMLRYDFRPVVRPIQNGELVDRQSRCGRK